MKFWQRVKIILKLFKLLFIAIASLIALCLLYLFIAYSFSLIIIEKKPITEPEDITIYLLSNGVHTDVVVPVKNNVIDWTKYFKYADTRSTDSTFRYLAIGWGDKSFYLEIPEWSDLTVSIALKAGLGLSSSAIHATFYRNVYEDELCRKLQITQNQYHNLVNYVVSFLKLDEHGLSINIKTDAQYGNHDAFYEARKSYHIFYTCNTWTNNLLKVCGQRACLWTPFSHSILNL